jgi:hypothetical protein
VVAAKWIKNKWGIFPTEKDVDAALFRKNFKILEWLYWNYPKLLRIPETFRLAVWNDNLAFAEQLMKGYTPEACRRYYNDSAIIHEDQYLKVLQWLKEHNVPLDLNHEKFQAIYDGYFRIFEWLVNNYPENTYYDAWHHAACYGLWDFYKLLLDKYPNGRSRDEMIFDFHSAVKYGRLKFVKRILKLDPLLAEKPLELKTNNFNMATCQYLVERYNWPALKKPSEVSHSE